MTLEELKDLRECMGKIQEGLISITYAVMKVASILDQNIQNHISDEDEKNEVEHVSANGTDISIKEFLIALGILYKKKGFNHLKTAIEIILEGGTYRNLYELIAQKCNTTYVSVEGGIRVVKREAQAENTAMFKRIFGENKKVPSNIEFIRLICKYIESNKSQ